MERYLIQGTPAWLKARCGRITGIRFADVLALNKRTGQPNAPRRKLIETLRKEVATGEPEWTEPNEYMAHGTRCEPIACALYEFVYGAEVEHVGLIVHPELNHVAFSADGLIGDDGMVEIKSPALEPRHLRTVESGKCPDDYLPQVMGGMWVTGRKWCDFTSFWEPTHELCVVRVYRDEQFIERLSAECAAVWAQVIAQEEIAA